MKLTKENLRQIIKEEFELLINETVEDKEYHSEAIYKIARYILAFDLDSEEIALRAIPRTKLLDGIPEKDHERVIRQAFKQSLVGELPMPKDPIRQGKLMQNAPRGYDTGRYGEDN